MSMRVRLLLLILVASLVPALVAGMQFFERREHEIAAARQELATAARGVAQDLVESVDATLQLQYGLARAQELDSRDRAACSAFLADAHMQFPQYLSILKFTPGGDLVCDSLRRGAALNVADRGYFRTAMNAANSTGVEAVVSRLTGNGVLTVAHAVRRKTGEPAFVLVASLNLDEIKGTLKQRLALDKSTVALVDGKGTVIAWHPDGEKMRGTSIADSPLHRLIRDSQDGNSQEEIESGGASRIWAAKAVATSSATELFVLAGISKEDLLDSANRGLNRALGILLVVWVSVSAVAWLLASGVMRREQAEELRIRALNDTLERRIAERTEQLRSNEERIRLLVSSVKDYAIIMLDPQGRVATWNEGARKIKGYEEAEILGQSMRHFYTPEDVAAGRPNQLLTRAEAEGRVEDNGERVRKDGSRFHADVVLTAVRNPAGELIGFANITRDVTENKRLEQAQHEKEQWLQAVLDSMAEGLVACDADGKLAIFNRAARDWHGADPRAIPPERWSEFYELFEVDAKTPLATERIPLMRAYQGEHVREAEMSIVRKGAPPRLIRASGTPLYDDAGRKRGAVVAMHDITARREAEIRLRESEERFRLLIKDVKDYAIMMLDPGGHVVTWNEGAQRLLGYAETEIIGKPMSRFFTHEEAATGRPAQLRARAADEGRVEDEGWRVRKAGSRFLANVVLTAMRDSAGELVGFAKIMRDVTERKRSEERIRGQLDHLRLLDQITRATGERQDLRSIFQVVVRSLEDSLPVDFSCVCLHDAAADALTVASVGAKSGSLAHELAMGSGMRIDVDANGLLRCLQGQLVYEPDIGRVRFPFPERLARGGLRAVVMAPLKSESRVFGVLVVARREAESFTSGECEFLRQLSEHVALAAHQAQLYESLQEAYDDLRATQEAAMQQERLRALGQMASGIAHDINNALSPVSLYTGSMLETEKGLSDRARGYLETIQRAVEDVAATVARMREFYRQREEQIELAPVDVSEMARQVLELTEARWSDMALERGTTVRAVTEFAADLPKIMGVESEIREALTNLVFNAVDAMPEGGTLSVRARLIGGSEGAGVVALEVVDTGIGMDEETRRRCLEPFFTTKGERGTGLGLAMVFGMVQRHSSAIEIDSAPGKGTTMRLLFDVPTEVVADAGPALAALEVPKHLRLLLVDDDPVLQKSLRDALEIDGHTIVVADGGQAGIDAFGEALKRGEPFAAVITDLGMPYVDGRKVAAAVKAASPATPVIMLTGWGQRMVAEGEIPAHVDRVLAKPPKLRAIREALAQLCRARSGVGGG